MNEDLHVGGVASTLVMLAAIATAFSTYSFYKEDEVATKYESDQVALEQTASALVSLRLQEQKMLSLESASTTDKESKETKAAGKPELQ